MDANKLKVLKEISYKIKKTCGLCVHGNFPKNDWGTCNIQTYEHLKHSESKRHLSIYKSGVCGAFKQKAGVLGTFEEFIN